MFIVNESIQKFVETNEFGGETHEEIGGVMVTSVASKLPWMSDIEFSELCESIREHGLRVKIKTDSNGHIVDGRNRMLACLETETQPEFEFTELGAIDAVVIENLRRRNMNSGAKALAWSKIYGSPVTDVVAKSDSESDTTAKKTTVREQTEKAAAEAGVSTRLMWQAKKVHEKGTEGLNAAVTSGTVSARTASKVAELPVEEQEKIVSGKEETEIARKAKEAERKLNNEQRMAKFDLGKFEKSFADKVSKILANQVPQDLRDKCHSIMAEQLNSTNRLERETEQRLDAVTIVPWVEDLIAGIAKSERASSELAIANRYASVVKIKDAESAIIAIDTIVDGLSAAEKKKVAASLRQQYAAEAAVKGSKTVKSKTLPMKPTAEVSRKA